MIVSYFDEATVEDIGFMYVCGWTATVEQWRRFEIDWRIFLAQFDVPYFHMKEFAHHKGPFAKFKEQPGTRRRFIQTAASIIRDTVQRGFICCVSDPTFDAVDAIYKLRSFFTSPYALAGRTCASMSAEWQWKQLHDPDFQFVFEDGAPDKGGLLKAMTEITPCLSSPKFEPSRDRKPDQKYPYGRKGVVQLQAADYLAYEIAKIGRDHHELRSGKKEPRLSLGVLPKEKVKSFFYNTHRISNVCKMLRIPKRVEG